MRIRSVLFACRRGLCSYKNVIVDPSVLVGILAGKGETFCAGYDLKELSEVTQVPSFEPFSLNSKGPMVWKHTQLSVLLVRVGGLTMHAGQQPSPLVHLV